MSVTLFRNKTTFGAMEKTLLFLPFQQQLGRGPSSEKTFDASSLLKIILNIKYNFVKLKLLIISIY